MADSLREDILQYADRFATTLNPAFSAIIANSDGQFPLSHVCSKSYLDMSKTTIKTFVALMLLVKGRLAVQKHIVSV
jgi:hypothetical protein